MTKTERRALESKRAELLTLIATGTSVDLTGDLARVERELGMWYAAIGTDGRDPVVWGLGATAEDAIADAAEQEPTWDDTGSATCVVTAAIAARIEAGVIDCGSLGIYVGVDHEGLITVAEMHAATPSYGETGDVELDEVAL